jgi:hypothetical protein
VDVRSLLRRLRGAVGNAVVWGGAWFTAALVVVMALGITGVVPGGVSWSDAVALALRLGAVGSVAGAAFSALVPLLYRGRRISELSWVRFAIGGGIVAGLFVPVLIVTAGLLSPSSFVTLNSLLVTALLAGCFGALTAGGSLRLAQHADALPAGTEHDRLDGAGGNRLPPAGEQDDR